MITYAPIPKLGEEKFYKDLVTSMGLPSNSVVINPFSGFFSLGVLDIASLEDFYFDISSYVNGIAAADRGQKRNLYHGNLVLTVQSTFAAAFTANTALTVPQGSGVWVDYLF